MMTMTYGLHLTLRLSDIQGRGALAESATIADFLKALVGRIGMRIRSGPLIGEETGSAEKSGCSGVIILYESHAAIHTYPSLGEAFIDVFSCRAFDVAVVIETVEIFFGAHQVSEQRLSERGLHWDRAIADELAEWKQSR
jgi:S-adenosylmethionine decarboxylase